jgi:membrane associated rhomboid family serine protease
MIDARCECGVAYSTPEADVGKQSVLCRKCGRELRFVSAEALPEGAGAGDFDTRLVVAAGPGRVGEQLVLGGCCEIDIGKSPERHLALAGERVSRLHCKLLRLDFGPSRWSLEDNHSTNGLFVNGQRVTSHELRHGDVVQVGDYQLKFLTDLALFPPKPAGAPAAAPGQPVCPSCGKALAWKAKICVPCGIYIATGKPLVTSKGFDEDDFAERAHTWIWVISWIIPFGLYPVASEAFGTRKPYATWVITGITVLASLLFFPVVYGDKKIAEVDPAFMNLMEWTGSRKVTERMRERFVERATEDLRRSEDDALTGEREVKRPRRGAPKRRTAMSEDELEELAEQTGRPPPPPEYPATIGFRWYQLFTHVLLHGGIMHLAGNMLFLIVFGLRVNELVGNWKMAILYPLLGVMAAGADMFAHLDSPMRPTLGASGAIMGLAGMYIVFFPVQKVRMAIWLRFLIPWLWWYHRFRVVYKVFSMPGIWLLALWIALQDLVPMFLNSSDQVAHWAHLGGFVSGVLLAVILLVARLVDGRRADLLSVALGRRAWALLGKPGGATPQPAAAAA